jgi:hypothetical protein
MGAHLILKFGQARLEMCKFSVLDFFPLKMSTSCQGGGVRFALKLKVLEVRLRSYGA